MYELNDTVKMMNSENYKDRFLAEFYQLKFRYHKLLSLLEKLHDGKLDSATYSLALLEKQAEAMCEYLGILQQRAQKENIIILDGPNSILEKLNSRDIFGGSADKNVASPYDGCNAVLKEYNQGSISEEK